MFSVVSVCMVRGSPIVNKFDQVLSHGTQPPNPYSHGSIWGPTHMGPHWTRSNKGPPPGHVQTCSLGDPPQILLFFDIRAVDLHQLKGFLTKIFLLLV